MTGDDATYDGKAQYSMPYSGSGAGPHNAYFVWWEDSNNTWNFSSEPDGDDTGSEHFASSEDASATNPWDADWSSSLGSAITVTEGDCESGSSSSS